MRIFLFAAVVLAAAAAHAQDAQQAVVPLTDPSRPAVLSVRAFGGNIVVRGTNRKDVLVRSADNGRRQSRRRDAEPPPGLRRLTPEPGFTIGERNNEISVEGFGCAGPVNPSAPAEPSPGRERTLRLPAPPKALPCGPMFDSTDFDIEVPLKTSLSLSTVNGDLTVNAVDGMLELETVNGAVSLTSVAGSVVAHSLNGTVTATLTRADAEAPMAFSTLNGNVDVTLPPAVKANLKLRTDNGDIFTDFDIPTATSRPTPRGSREGDGRFRLEVERAVVTALNGGGPDIELRSFNGRVYLRKGK